MLSTPPSTAVRTLAAAFHPRVSVIINHWGLSILADGLDEWCVGLTVMTTLPQVAIKLSGTGFMQSPFVSAAFADIVQEVIALSGTQRVMVATNFPTDRLFATLDETLSTYYEAC